MKLPWFRARRPSEAPVAAEIAKKPINEVTLEDLARLNVETQRRLYLLEQRKKTLQLRRPA